MKTCFKCGERKPLSDFYKHKQMADGHVNKCKECNKRDVRDNRKSKVDYYREYDRDRGSRHGPGYVGKWRSENPGKAKAHAAIRNAVRSGKMKKVYKCQECGSESTGTHAHHDDYAYPLSVRWLCPACHKAWHDKNGEAPNGR